MNEKQVKEESKRQRVAAFERCQSQPIYPNVELSYVSNCVVGLIRGEVRFVFIYSEAVSFRDRIMQYCIRNRVRCVGYAHFMQNENLQ